MWGGRRVAPPLCGTLASALAEKGLLATPACRPPTRMFVTDASYSTERRDEVQRLVLYLHGFAGDPDAAEARVSICVEQPPTPYIVLWRARRALDPLLPCALWRIGIYSVRGPAWRGLCAWMRRTTHRILRKRVKSVGMTLGNRVMDHWVSDTPHLHSDSTELHNTRKNGITQAVLTALHNHKPARWAVYLYAITPPDIGMLKGALLTSNEHATSEVCIGGVLEYTARVALDKGWGSMACWLDMRRIDWSTKTKWLDVQHFGVCGRIDDSLRVVELPNPTLTRATYDLEVPGQRHIQNEAGCDADHTRWNGALPLPLPCGCGAHYTDAFPDGSTPILSDSVKITRGATSLCVCLTVQPSVGSTPVVTRRTCGSDFQYHDVRVGSELQLLEQKQALLAGAGIHTLVGYNSSGFDDWMLATRAAGIERDNTRIWVCEHDKDTEECIICHEKKCKHDIRRVQCDICAPRRNEMKQKMTLRGTFRFGSRNVGRAINVTKGKKGSKGKGGSVCTDVRSAHGITFYDVMIQNVKDSPCSKEGGGNGLDAAVAFFLKRAGKADMKYDHQIMAWQRMAAAPPGSANKLVRYCMYDTWLTDELYAFFKCDDWALTLAQTVGGLAPNGAINRGHLDKIKPARERIVSEANRAGGGVTHTIKCPPDKQAEGTYEAAVVFDPGTGIYTARENTIPSITVLDFAALYPSCIIWWNLGDDTLITSLEELLALWYADIDIVVVRPIREGETLNDYGRLPLPTTESDMRTAFSADKTYFYLGGRDGNRSILAQMMLHMRHLRTKHKKLMKAGLAAGDTQTARVHDLLQNAAKVLMNAVYGAVGWGAISYGKAIAYCICCAGQDAIRVAADVCVGFTHGDVCMCGSQERVVINPEWNAVKPRAGSKVAKDAAGAAGCVSLVSMMGLKKEEVVAPKRLITLPQNHLPLAGGDTDSVFVGCKPTGKLKEAIDKGGITVLAKEGRVAIEEASTALSAAITEKVNGKLTPKDQWAHTMEFEECFTNGATICRKKMYVALKGLMPEKLEELWGKDKCGDQMRRIERFAATLPSFQKKRGLKLVKGSTPRAIVVAQTVAVKMLCVGRIDMAVEVAQAAFVGVATYAISLGMLANYETRRLEVYNPGYALHTILQDPYIAAQFPVGAKLAFIHVPEWIKARSSRKKSEGMCLLSDAIHNQWPYDIPFYMESMLNAFKQIFCAVWPDEDVKKNLMPVEFEHRLRMLQTNAERGMRGGSSDILSQMKTESTTVGRVACVNCNTLFVASGETRAAFF